MIHNSAQTQSQLPQAFYHAISNNITCFLLLRETKNIKDATQRAEGHSKYTEEHKGSNKSTCIIDRNRMILIKLLPPTELN